MPKFGKRSTKKLETVHQDLQDVLNEAIKYVWTKQVKRRLC